MSQLRFMRRSPSACATFNASTSSSSYPENTVCEKRTSRNTTTSSNTFIGKATRKSCVSNRVEFTPSSSSNSSANNPMMARLFIGITILLLTIGTSGVLAEGESNGSGSSSGRRSDEIQIRIKTFLESHCKDQNETLEQAEFEDFISCNPTQATTTFQNLEAFKELDVSTRHQEILKELNKLCSSWPEEKTCQKNNFKLIQKCFGVQRTFVFYFMFALTDTMCQDKELFVDFWNNGGAACLKERVPNLTKYAGECFSQTSTMTREEFDRNIMSNTACIGDKFDSCSSSQSNEVISNLLKDIESFYGETKGSSGATNSAASVTPTYQSLSSLYSHKAQSLPLTIVLTLPLSLLFSQSLFSS